MLDQIQLADGISRAEIAERTGLTPQTVSGITRKLLDEGIVREDGSSRVEGLGKPRTTLRINSDAGSAVGLHFDPVELACVVVDLVGHPLVLKRRPTPAGARPDEVVAAMADLAGDVLAEADVPRERVLGLGLASPGPIDQDSGMVVAPPKLAHWTRVPMKQLLSEATGLPVTLDNDATAAAIGERWSGAAGGRRLRLLLLRHRHRRRADPGPPGPPGRLAQRRGVRAHLRPAGRPALLLRKPGVPGEPGQPRRHRRRDAAQAGRGARRKRARGAVPARPGRASTTRRSSPPPHRAIRSRPRSSAMPPTSSPPSPSTSSTSPTWT
ncbi:ROK family transcriptional regulator [Actinomadura madurae]|nr:ROK family transcriptional regulator [Actinomadura madurae]